MDCIRSLSRDSKLPRLEAQMLWQHVLGVERVWLIAHDTDPLDPSAVARYRALEARRVLGEPMAYLVGRREFMGHDFQVSPSVLIPRPETELLVEAALQFIEGRSAPVVLDLGTGTGAVAVSIALARPDADVTATDASTDALKVAEANAKRLGGKVRFAKGDWYDALVPSRGFDLIVSNPPYIAVNDPHLAQGDVRFEPTEALTDGDDGMTALRTIIEGAARWLVPQGGLFLEHGWDQAAAVTELLLAAGFSKVASLQDLAGIQRVTGGIYNQVFLEARAS